MVLWIDRRLSRAKYGVKVLKPSKSGSALHWCLNSDLDLLSLRFMDHRLSAALLKWHHPTCLSS